MQNSVKNLYMQIMLLVVNKLECPGFELLLRLDCGSGKSQ